MKIENYLFETVKNFSCLGLKIIISNNTTVWLWIKFGSIGCCGSGHLIRVDADGAMPQPSTSGHIILDQLKILKITLSFTSGTIFSAYHFLRSSQIHFFCDFHTQLILQNLSGLRQSNKQFIHQFIIPSLKAFRQYPVTYYIGSFLTNTILQKGQLKKQF